MHDLLTQSGPSPQQIILPTRYQKVLQVISPKKTMTGVIGGIFLGALTGLLFGLLRAREALPVLPSWALVEYLALGGVLGVLAQAGDLLESFMKRAAKTKVRQCHAM